MSVEQITFDDIKNNHKKVLDYLDATFFTDSTVTMMTEEYIKKSVSDRLLQTVFLSEGVVSLDKDAEALSKGMLRASLSAKDINFILNASLRISGITMVSAKEFDKIDTNKANSLVEQQKAALASVDNIIGLIDDCLGTARVTLTSSVAAQYAHTIALSSLPKNATPPPEVADVLSIELPLKTNFSFIDLTKLDNNKILEILSGLMGIDSNSTLNLHIPLCCLTDNIISYINTDLPAFTEVAYQHVSQLNHAAAASFNFEQDGFQSLFNSL